MVENATRYIINFSIKMASPEPRIITYPLLSVNRCAPRFRRPLAKNLSPAQALGLSFEKKVAEALRGAIRFKSGFHLDRNPWFEFMDAYGRGICSPDVLISDKNGRVILVETKLTWTPAAAPKITGLYLPVVTAFCATHKVHPVIICKNLLPGAINTITSLCSVLDLSPGHISTLQWLGREPFPW